MTTCSHCTVGNRKRIQEIMNVLRGFNLRRNVCVYVKMLKKFFLSSLTELPLYKLMFLFCFFLIWACYYFTTGLSSRFPPIAALEPISINLPGVLGVHRHFSRPPAVIGHTINRQQTGRRGSAIPDALANIHKRATAQSP